jgi:hypothetical protein
MTCRCHALDTFNRKHVVEDAMHHACVNGVASTAGMKSFHVILFANMRIPDRGLLSVAIVRHTYQSGGPRLLGLAGNLSWNKCGQSLAFQGVAHMI